MRAQIRIGIMSDSHFNTAAIEQAVCEQPDLDCWFHAGDNYADSKYLATIADVPVYAVKGNCDWMTKGPRILTPEILGIKFLLTHGDEFYVKYSLAELVEYAQEEKAQVVIYGHTHIGFQDNINGILVLNPGSLSQPRDGGYPSYMVLNVYYEENSNGNITVKNFAVERYFLGRK